jgi:hypothetical protein
MSEKEANSKVETSIDTSKNLDKRAKFIKYPKLTLFIVLLVILGSFYSIFKTQSFDLMSAEEIEYGKTYFYKPDVYSMTGINSDENKLIIRSIAEGISPVEFVYSMLDLESRELSEVHRLNGFDATLKNNQIARLVDHFDYYELLIYNISDGQSKSVPINKATEKFDFSGDVVVWVDYTHNTTGKNIYNIIYDYKGVQYNLASYSDEFGFDIMTNGEKIVHSFSDKVHIFDVDSEEMKVITPERTSHNILDLYKNKILLAEITPENNAILKIYDMDSDTFKVVHTGNSMIPYASIVENTVVWLEYGDDSRPRFMDVYYKCVNWDEPILLADKGYNNNVGILTDGTSSNQTIVWWQDSSKGDDKIMIHRPMPCGAKVFRIG